MANEYGDSEPEKDHLPVPHQGHTDTVTHTSQPGDLAEPEDGPSPSGESDATTREEDVSGGEMEVEEDFDLVGERVKNTGRKAIKVAAQLQQGVSTSTTFYAHLSHAHLPCKLFCQTVKIISKGKHRRTTGPNGRGSESEVSTPLSAHDEDEYEPDFFDNTSDSDARSAAHPEEATGQVSVEGNVSNETWKVCHPVYDGLVRSSRYIDLELKDIIIRRACRQPRANGVLPEHYQQPVPESAAWKPAASVVSEQDALRQTKVCPLCCVVPPLTQTNATQPIRQMPSKTAPISVSTKKTMVCCFRLAELTYEMTNALLYSSTSG